MKIGKDFWETFAPVLTAFSTFALCIGLIWGYCQLKMVINQYAPEIHLSIRLQETQENIEVRKDSLIIKPIDKLKFPPGSCRLEITNQGRVRIDQSIEIFFIGEHKKIGDLQKTTFHKTASLEKLGLYDTRSIDITDIVNKFIKHFTNMNSLDEKDEINIYIDKLKLEDGFTVKKIITTNSSNVGG